MAMTGDLASRVAGPVLRPGDDGYAGELAGFDLAVSQRPAVVVGATGAADVIAAVRYARDAGLAVGVQATGHGITVPADDALLITTRRADAVRVDPSDGTAWIEAGALWSRVLHEAAPFGLAPLAGSAPAVGAVSYTLGGGIGVLGRRWGFSADHVRRLDVVTADGVPRRVTAEDHPDLFWALRGGGGNVGVVTGMQVGLVELAEVYGGGLFFAGEDAGAVLPAVVDACREAPDEVSLSVAMVSFPDLPAVGPLRGRWSCWVRVTSSGTPARCEEVIAPIRAAATPFLDTVRTMPVTDLGTIHNDPVTPTATNGHSLTLHSVDADTVAALLRHARPDTPFVIEVRQLGGALAREPAVPNAVGHRGAVAYPLRHGLPAPHRTVGVRRRRGAGPARRPRAVERRRGARQLPRRRPRQHRRRPRRLRARPLGPPRRDQDGLGPGQRLPDQPQRPAGAAGRRGHAAVACTTWER